MTRKYCRIFICITIICFCQTFFGVQNTLETSPGFLEQIDLPFSYKQFTTSEIDRTEVLFESCYTTLTPDGETKFVLMTPLNPCIGIVLYNNQTRSAILAHANYTNDIRNFIQRAKDLFKSYAPSQMSGLLYTCRNQEYNWPCSSSFKELSWRECYQGRTQKEELEELKKVIVDQLGLSPDTVATTICDLPGSTDNKLQLYYPFVTLSIVVWISANGVEYNHTCMLHEEMVFSNIKSCLKMVKPCDAVIFKERIKELKRTLWIKGIARGLFADILDKCLLQKYGSIEFRRADRQFSRSFLSQTPLGLCNFCKKIATVNDLKRCGRCREVLYCSKECQKLGWGEHKKSCLPPK